MSGTRETILRRARTASLGVRLTTVLITAVLALPWLADDLRAQDRPYMVAAANPHASVAGIEMLALGGSATDAAVAVQAVLGLVEPQSSGLGGGAFMLHYAAETQAVSAYDGRETAPETATPALFVGANGEPMAWRDASLSGRAVGVPGVVDLLWKAHQQHGKLAWKRLFEPAIRLARQGFAVSPRLNALITGDKWLATRPSTRAYFYQTGADGAPQALPVGTTLRNDAYANTLATIAALGPDGFYRGAIARSIVDTVTGADVPGQLSLDDMAGYEAKVREPVCRPYRDHTVCGMPPPTSGGVTTLQILGALEGVDMGSLAPGSVEAVHMISEASRLAFADRGLYLADPDFVPQPVKGLLAADYLKRRAALIDPQVSMGKAAAGEPDGRGGHLVPGDDRSLPSTSHFSIVDADGNAVSMTTSVESAFGSHMMASGFLLNNQLTDFSFTAERDGQLVANRVEGGKRPRSSMSPTLVLDSDGNLVAAVGSPGGSRIIGYVAKTLIGVLDWDLSMQAAIDLPHHTNRNGGTDLEDGTAIAGLDGALTAMGHEVNVRALTSGLHGILVRGSALEGGADRRREGVVLSGTAR